MALPRFTTIAFIAVVTGILSGCSYFGTDKAPTPLGISPDPNALKQSPCACFELPNRIPGRV